MIKQEEGFKYYKFGIKGQRLCSFIKTNNSVHLERLFGMPCTLSKGQSLKTVGIDLFRV